MNDKRFTDMSNIIHKSWMNFALCLTLLICVSSTVSAQNGLAVAKVFDGRYRNNSNAVEVIVKGRKLKPYKLTTFHSLTLHNSPDDAKWIASLVAADGKRASDKEVGLVRGKLYYGFYMFINSGNKGAPYRYLFFRDSSVRDNKDKEMTVVYMEGSASIAELKKMFK